MDYAGLEAEIGKRVGDDLREGKPTLPLIYAMATGSAQEREMIREAILQPEAADFNQVVGVITRTGAMQYTLDCAQRECQLAASAISGLRESDCKSALLDLLTFVVDRRG